MARTIALTLLFLLPVFFAFAQEEVYYEMTDDDVAYRAYRSKITVPPYGLSKVKGLIKSIKAEPAEEGDGGLEALTAGQFTSLGLREKFTYVMIHPEVYAQNCAIFIPQPNEQSKVFSHLISWMDETQWSDRQINFLRECRDSVMHTIEESTRRSKHMGVNYKDAIVTINGWEMIPFLVDYFKGNKKDKDVLTVLLLLMHKGKYDDFISSPSYKKLYGSDYNYESCINYNQSNEDLIISRALGYHREKQS